MEIGLFSRQRVIFVGAFALAFTAAGAQITAVRAGGCGGDSLSACPSIDSVSPRGWEAGSGGVTITISGQALSEVTSVTLEPVGRELPITSATDDRITVVAPASLAVGGYTLHLDFGGNLLGVNADSPVLYIATGQAAMAPVVSFAPNPSSITPAPAAAAPSRATAPAPASSHHGFLFFLGGLLLGGGACLLIARRLGVVGGRDDVATDEQIAGEPQAVDTVPIESGHGHSPAHGHTSPSAETPPPGGAGWSVRPQTPRFPA